MKRTDRNSPLLGPIFNALLVIVCLSCASKTEPKAPAPAIDTTASSDIKTTPTDTYSNIRPADYVGPETCGECHPKNHASWKNHPHSRMNALATDASVLGDFSGTPVIYAGRKAVFRKENGDFIAEYFEDEKRVRRFKITRTIGWRYEQDYVAVQTFGPESPGDPLYTDEIRLRFSYSFDRQRWLPQSYMEPTEYPGSEYLEEGSLRYDPFQPDSVAFNNRCARCHNTYPYDLRLYKIHNEDGMVSGFPPGPGANQDVVKTLAEEAGDLRFLQEKTELPTDRFVTVGIGCESCHFGGREHSVDGTTPIRFVPSHPLLAKWTPDHINARKNPTVVNAICRQCHHSGESAKDNWPDGSAGVNSMEAIEQDRGACAGELRCTHCHNTHISGPEAGSPDRSEHLEACLACHEDLQSESATAAHTRHTPDQANCLDCHMPRIVQGFGAYNRTHRIASPTDPAILGTGMPNACNLCHLDKSLAWTRDELEKGWGKRIVLPESLGRHFGPGFQRAVGEAWLTHPFPHTRSVAAGAFTDSPLRKQILPTLVQHLDEPNAYLRERFLQAVEKILGRTLTEEEYALTGSREQRTDQVRHLLERHTRQ